MQFFFQVCKNFEQRNPYKFDLLHLNFHHKATSNLKAWIYLYFYKMCGIFFFKKWTAKKNISPLLSSNCNVLSSWNPILPYCQRENRAFFGFEDGTWILISNVNTKIYIRFSIYGNMCRIDDVYETRIFNGFGQWTFYPKNCTIFWVYKRAVALQTDCNLLRSKAFVQWARNCNLLSNDSIFSLSTRKCHISEHFQPCTAFRHHNFQLQSE